MKVRSILLLAAIVGASLGAVIPGHAADPRVCNQATAFPTRTILKFPGAQGTVLYLDDRGKGSYSLIGLNGGEGTWGYLESNGKPKLQTGGYQVVFEAAQDYEDADALGEHDKSYCNEDGTAHTGIPDTIIF